MSNTVWFVVGGVSFVLLLGVGGYFYLKRLLDSILNAYGDTRR